MAFVFPVVGKTEWSPGSWMPNTQTHRGRTHAAIDIYAERGQIIVSPVSGTVRSLGSGNVGGNWIQITGDDGNTYYFAHMDRQTTLEKGQRITGGAMIGLVGNTGSAKHTHPHLHFSVKHNGKAVSPVSMLQGAVVVPDVAVTGSVGESSPAPWDDPNYWGDMASVDTNEALPEGAQEQTPAWFDQLAQAREDRLSASATEDPVKVKASRVMHGVLSGMASMVRSSGFQTDAGDGTGIGEVNEIDREAGER
jgi:hypothetical protein